jgi:hypothetical protein
MSVLIPMLSVLYSTFRSVLSAVRVCIVEMELWEQGELGAWADFSVSRVTMGRNFDDKRAV